MSGAPGCLTTATLDSPLGPLLVAATPGAVCLVEYASEQRATRQLGRIEQGLGVSAVPGPSDLIKKLDTELAAYFAGEAVGFKVTLDLIGTPFQKRVWRELLRIPYGETRSYAAIAKAIGGPSATRAVGTANGANPISILVPCHRVVRTGGALGGYGGGLERKQWLLEHERAASGAALFS